MKMTDDRNEWIHAFKREIYPIVLNEIMEGLIKSYKNILFVYASRIVTTYFKEKEINEKSKDFFKLKPPSELQEEKDKIISLYENATAWAKEKNKILVKRNKAEDLSRDDALDILKTLQNYYRQIGSTIWIFHYYAEDKLVNELKRIMPGHEQHSLMRISRPIEPSDEKIEEIELLKLVVEVKKRGILNKIYDELDEIKEYIEKGEFKPFFANYMVFCDAKVLPRIKNTMKNAGGDWLSNKIKNHTFNYGWIRKDYGFGDPQTEDDFLSRMTNYLLEEEPESQLKISHMEYPLFKRTRNEELRYCYRKDPEFKDKYKLYADYLSLNAFIRFKRRTTLTQLDFYTRPIIEKIIDIYNEKNPEEIVSKREINFLVLDEIIDILQNDEIIDKKKIKEREKYWVKEYEYDKQDNKVKVSFDNFGSKAKEYARIQKVPAPPLKRASQLKGTPRLVGPVSEKIIGRVKVVLLHEDLEKIREGDIMVTLMVIPSYIGYLDKVRAIITEEGTMTCHAITLYQEFMRRRAGMRSLITDVEWVTHHLRDNNLIEIDPLNGDIIVKESE